MPPYQCLLATNAVPVVFTEPLRSRTFRVLTMATTFVFGIVLITYLHYGTGKIKMKDPALRPLQQFMEASTIILAGGIVLLCAFADRLSKRKIDDVGSTFKEMDFNAFDSAKTPKLAFSDIQTVADLISQYDVTIGERPDPMTLLAKTRDFHTDQSISTDRKSPMVCLSRVQLL